MAIGARVVVDSPIVVLDALLTAGWRVIGPKLRDDAIAYEQLLTASDLPRGVSDAQEAGRYRLTPGDPDRWFDYVVGPQNWKRWLFPSRKKLWSSQKTDDGFTIEPASDPWPKTAFFGIRSCDISALGILDKVLTASGSTDPDYKARRADTLIVAVQCARAAKTCFCASMGTGPHAEAGFDLALTELEGGRIVVECGSERGRDIFNAIEGESADDEIDELVKGARAAATADQTRAMPPDIGQVLAGQAGSPLWNDVAKKCLACANCTLACPTCFCTDTEDINDLSGDHAERWRVWDSCFNLDFSYIHGGEVRRSTLSRYRQWMSHKLSTWHEQFGTSGCVGCGRCIAWCPVGIDITEEAAAFAPKPQAAE